MAGFDKNWLSILVFFPLVWALVSLVIPSRSSILLKAWAFLGSLLVFLFSLNFFFLFSTQTSDFQFVEKASWIPFLGVSYALGLDGISLWLILLTTFLMPITILFSFGSVKLRLKEYFFFLLALETGMLGAFVALDVFLFYVFWEAMLIPMYFLIGIWGGKDRIYAAMKFFLFTLVGSLLMLVAVFYLAYQYKLQMGVYSTLLTDLYQLHLPHGDGFWNVQNILFLAFALAFAIKVPLFPLHTWLPDAHVQAPTAGSVILAAVLLKMGGYGFIRFAFPLFPNAVAYFQLTFLILGVAAIVYGACVAMVQPDMKKLVAYSSVSHMGYVVLGLFSLEEAATTGSMYQMLNHGISTGALFLLVGMIYDRRHTREISAFGGIARIMPIFATIFLIVTLSSIALPGTNGFVGEFLILLGVWKVNPFICAFAGLGVIFGAIYMLWMFQRVMLGPIKSSENEKLKDLTRFELVVLAPLIVAIFVMGVYPNFFLSKMQPSIQHFLKMSSGTPLQQKLFASDTALSREN